MTKGNNGSQASLLILKRELLHQETAWETLSVHSCYAWKIALHLTLFTNSLGLTFASASLSGHGSRMEVPYKLDWYGIAAETSKEKYNSFELFLLLTKINRRLCTFL